MSLARWLGVRASCGALLLGCSTIVEADRAFVTTDSGRVAAPDAARTGPPDSGSGLDATGLSGIIGPRPPAYEQIAYVKAEAPLALAVFGLPVALQGTRLLVGAAGDSVPSLGTDGAAVGSAYLFEDVTRTAAPRRFLPPSPKARDNVVPVVWPVYVLDPPTVSVAMDAERLVVGFGGEDLDGVEDAGAVYVFTRGAAGWELEQRLPSPFPRARDVFGFRVALSGDVLAVGAPWEDAASVGPGGAPSSEQVLDSGAVHVFRRGPAGWGRVAYLKPDVGNLGGRFGSSIALSAGRLAVGAPGDASPGVGVGATPGPAAEGQDLAGAVHTYVEQGGGFSRESFIKPPRPTSQQLFGTSLALSATTLVVGAPSTQARGAVHVYDLTGGQIRASAGPLAAPLSPGDTTATDMFGTDVALDGDVLVVGAPRDRRGGRGIDPPVDARGAAMSGAVHVFRRRDGGFAQVAFLKASNADDQDYLGYSVAVSGGLVAAGALGEDSAVAGAQDDEAAPFAGAVYVFRELP